MLYRILTENVNLRSIIELCNNHFSGFTIIRGFGYWHNQAEQSLIIEIVTENNTAVRQLAAAIKELNQQEAIMIQAWQIGSWLI